MEDEFVENDECFEVGIILPESVSGRDIAEGLDTAVVCIKDNNSKFPSTHLYYVPLN